MLNCFDGCLMFILFIYPTHWVLKSKCLLNSSWQWAVAFVIRFCLVLFSLSILLVRYMSSVGLIQIHSFTHKLKNSDNSEQKRLCLMVLSCGCEHAKALWCCRCCNDQTCLSLMASVQCLCIVFRCQQRGSLVTAPQSQLTSPCHGHTLSSASAEAMSVFSIGSVAVSWSVLRALQIIGVLGVSCVETLMLGRGLASRAVTLQF